MKPIYLMATLLCWIASYTTTWGQCDPTKAKGITTNPSQPVNNEKPSKRNTFDWRNTSYPISSVYLLGRNSLPSPHYQNNNGNVSFLFESKDIRPEDGWELIQHDLGTNSNKADYVFVILYNKYRSVLRVFVAGDPDGAYNGSEIKIEFDRGITETYSSVLSNASDIFALDKFESDPILQSTADYKNGSAWFYADFVMSYDPCTCFYESGLKISVALIDNAIIELSGRLEGTLTAIEDGKGVGVKENGFSFNELVKGGQKASKTYQNINKFTSDQLKKSLNETQYGNQIRNALGSKKIIDVPISEAEKEFFLLNPSQTTIQQYNKFKDGMNVFQKVIAKSDFLKKGLKAAPYIGAAVEFLDLFIGGGNKPPGPQEVKITPTAIDAKINLSGSISATYAFDDVTIYTPGSKNAQNKQADRYPYYNEVLGIFNLLKTPVVKEEHYQSVGAYNPSDNSVNVDVKDLFRLDINSIQYVINPAAGFKTDNVEILAKFTGALSTDYVPLGLLGSFSLERLFKLRNGSNLGNVTGCGSNGFEPQLFIKFLINLERKDADANTQNVLLSMTYPVEIKRKDISSPPARATYCSVQDAITVSGGTLNNSLQAYSSITINGGTLTSGSVTAGQEITVNPNTTINPSTTLETGVVGSRSAQLAPANKQTITNFCNSGTYKNQRALRSSDSNKSQVIEAETSSTPNIVMYPNPTRDVFTLRYTGGAAAYQVRIYDLQGALVVKRKASVTESQIDLSPYPAGLYVVEVLTDQGERWQEKILKE